LIYLAAVVATACFGFALRLVGIVAVASNVMATSKAAAATLRDPTLGDLEKEQRVQKASLSLLGGFVGILARGAAALAAGALAVFAFDAAGLSDAGAVGAFLATWQGILLSCAAMAVAFLIQPIRR
jgi:hypothetical protein